MEYKTFVASKGASTGTTGFTNYMGTADIPGTLTRVWEEFPDAVVVDGEDDWYAKPETRPTVFCREFGIEPLAMFHSGISGMTRSGVVLTEPDFIRLLGLYEAIYGKPLAPTCRIHRRA